MTYHATPPELIKRAVLLEQEAETFASVGLSRQAGDLRDRAANLRRLSMEASNFGGRGE